MHTDAQSRAPALSGTSAFAGARSRAHQRATAVQHMRTSEQKDEQDDDKRVDRDDGHDVIRVSPALRHDVLERALPAPTPAFGV
mmetsp:Transcript_17416/g.54135  ORF Transcript_17416/g.54135 Transcript_17416/m.54135 type:complete len:84 (-) Transcript_17416:224-475(-)